MNDENENNEPLELEPGPTRDLPLDEEAEAREALILELQEEIDQLQSEADSRDDAAIIAAQADPVAPAGDAALRALAVTVRTAQRSGHPDAGKHLDALLTALGAV